MSPQRPNIIVFMTDHQRGETILADHVCKTPNIDKFRSRAVTFSQAYCTAPHCCPSRTSFFSGLYPSGHGVWNNVNVSNTLSRKPFDDVRLFSEDLKEAGYQLYYSGKWHVSAEKGPDQYGFELIFPDSIDYRPYPHLAETSEWKVYTDRPQKIDRGEGERSEGRILREGYTKYTQYGVTESPYRDREVTEAAIDKLEKMDQSKPFFLYVGTLGPHDPYFCPQRFLDLYDPDEIELPESFDDDMADKPAMYRRTKERYEQLTREEHKECVRRFYAFCSYEDYLFGQIVDKVESLGIMDNTLILYLSDHGDYVGAHGLWAKGIPAFREAYRICSMIGGGPIKSPGRTVDSLISITDYAPTFLALAGINNSRYFSGQSLIPFLLDQKPSSWRTEHYTQTNGNEAYAIQRSVWNDRYKYVFNAFDYDELYDLQNDPHEMRNLLSGIKNVSKSPYGEIVREMCAKLWRFAYENKDTCVNPYIMTAFAPYGPGIVFDREGKLIEK